MGGAEPRVLLRGAGAGRRRPTGSAPERPPPPRRRRRGRPRPAAPRRAGPRPLRPAARPGVAAHPRPGPGRGRGLAGAAPPGALRRPRPRPRGAPARRARRRSSLSPTPLLAASGARPCGARRRRSRLAATLLVVVPSAAFIGMGAAADRPYGQDGGVVQLPLAIDKILAGESPYGADYSSTVLARQARVSSFWDECGGNPILRHHAYLPGTHLVMLPFHLASRAAFGGFDPRVGHAPLLRPRRPSRRPPPGLGRGPARRGGDRGPEPARLLAPDLRRERPRLRGDGARRGAPRAGGEARRSAARSSASPAPPSSSPGPSRRSCSWRSRGPAPSATSRAPPPWRRVLAARAAAAAVFLAVVAPRRGPRLPRVLGRHRRLQRRPARRRQLPARGHARLRLRQLPDLLRPRGRACGTTSRSRSSTPCSCRSGSSCCGRSCGTGARSGRSPRAAPRSSPRSTSRASSTRTTSSPPRSSCPLAVLARRRGADLALAPLLLLALAVGGGGERPLRTAWEQAAAAGLPARLSGLAAALAPRAGPTLTKDPLGLLFSATAAGLGVLYLALAVCGAPRRARLAVTALGGGPRGRRARLRPRGGLRTDRRRPRAGPRRRPGAGRRGRLLARRSPYTPPPETSPRGREAVSASFRLDPPAEILPVAAAPAAGAVGARRPHAAPGRAGPAARGRPRPRRPRGACSLPDSRAVVVGRRSPSRCWRGRWPSGRCSAPRRPVPRGARRRLGGRASRRRLSRRGCWPAAAVALDHRALLVSPFLVRSPPEAGGPRGRPLPGLRRVPAGRRASRPPRPRGVRGAPRREDAPGPGLGLFNLLAYRGAEASAGALALAALAPLLLGGLRPVAAEAALAAARPRGDREPRRHRARAGRSRRRRWRCRSSCWVWRRSSRATGSRPRPRRPTRAGSAL